MKRRDLIARVSPAADYRYAPLPGRSLLPLLEMTDSIGFDRVFATHSFHEINLSRRSALSGPRTTDDIPDAPTIETYHR